MCFLIDNRSNFKQNNQGPTSQLKAQLRRPNFKQNNGVLFRLSLTDMYGSNEQQKMQPSSAAYRIYFFCCLEILIIIHSLKDTLPTTCLPCTFHKLTFNLWKLMLLVFFQLQHIIFTFTCRSKLALCPYLTIVDY